MVAEFIGLGAAGCMTISFLPQVVRAWRTHSTADLSFLTFLVFTLGVLLWLVYGLILRDAPLIIANGITFVLSGTILYLKLRYG